MYESSEQRDFARKLRKESTPEERRLWNRLRKRQLCDFRFRRQFAIGPYIADFECFERKLIVELDGGQHNTPGAREYDEERTRYFESRGYRVIRFWNANVNEDMDSVLEAIAIALDDYQAGRPHPGPPPEGEGAI